MNMEYKRLGNIGVEVPVLGLGTWGIGGFWNASYARDRSAIEVIRKAVDLGLSLIDTAEIYASGHAEELVGEAVKGMRGRAFIATKVRGSGVRYDDVLRACDGSLGRLKTSFIDLYQVHWPNRRVPIKETMKAMERLVEEGKVRFVGVSNFSAHEMAEAQASLAKVELASNQVEYSLLERSVEKDVLPYCEKNGIILIAYSPFAQSKLLRGKAVEALREVAARCGKTPAQIALNWLIGKPPVIAIPKAADSGHLEEDAGAVGWRLSNEDQAFLDRAFS